MGTRHLICVKHNGVMFGQYAQWDGYPEDSGAKTLLRLLAILDSDDALNKFVKNFDNAKFFTKDEIRAMGEDWLSKHPQLSRDTGAEILDYILDTPRPELWSQIEFAGDSLFCEYAYLLDFDAGDFVTFKGGNHERLEKGEVFRYLDQTLNPDDYSVKTGYRAIKEIHRISFGSLDCKQLTMGPEEVMGWWLEQVCNQEE